MKLQDERIPFVDDFIRYQGYPDWRHVKVNVHQPGYTTSEPESDTLVSIPIVEDEKNYIKSVLAIKVNSEVWYKLLEGNNYSELPVEDPENPEALFTAMDFLKLMMELEYEMFGHNQFEIIDESVINHSFVQETFSSQIISSGGCTTFNWGYYTLEGFVIVSSEQICLYETGELIYTLTPPISTGPGSGGGVGGSSDNTSMECRRGFVYIDEFDESGNPVVPCELIQDPPDSIPSILSRKADHILDSLYRWGMDNGFREQSFILVKKNGEIYAKNFTEGSYSGDQTKVNYTLESGEELIAYLHTHAEDTINFYRSSFSPNDLIEFNKNATTVGYTALLEVGNARYAFVLEDVQKKSVFNYTKRGRHKKHYNDLLNSLLNQFSDGQYSSEQAWIQYLGSVNDSGIGFYKAEGADKKNFIKLNP